MTAHNYEVYSRSPVWPYGRTGLCRNVQTFSYTRRYQANGEFSLSVPEEAPELLRLLPGNLIEISRDGQTDFVGYVMYAQRTWDERQPASAIAQLKGLDLSGWLLRQRIALPPTAATLYYGNAGLAETVMKQAILDHFIAPLDPSRTVPYVQNETLHSPLLGNSVTINLRGEKWDAEMATLALAGEVGYRVALLPSGSFEFQVYKGTVRTATQTAALTAIFASGAAGSTGEGNGGLLPASGSTLSGGSVSFSWNAVTDSLLYDLTIGTTPQGFDLGVFKTAMLSQSVSGLPTNGSTIYVSLYVLATTGEITRFDASYTAFNAGTSGTAGTPATTPVITPAVVFSPDYRDLLSFVYELDLQNLENHVYTIGGTSTTADRFIVEDEDATSIAAWGRYEAMQDGRNAFNADIAHTEGSIYLAPKIPVQRIAFKPKDAAQTQYKTDWDLGDLVTVRYGRWGVDLDLPIVEIKISSTPGTGETIEISTSMLTPDVVRKLRQMIATVQPALFSPAANYLPKFAGVGAVPTTPPLVPGQKIFDTTSNTELTWDGSHWNTTTQIPIYAGTAAVPTTPAIRAGFQFLDSTNAYKITTWDGTVWRVTTWV